ncbi:MAG TPA: cupin domain-containing protein [Methylibium sp.]|nr:cupin domain-containing protein [Methylibium sp.]
MDALSFDAYAAAARARGYEQVLERDWAPGTVVDEHAHPFAAAALVVRGEMWLSVGAATSHLRPGQTFELDAGVLHAERYGPDGATYWVARRG